MSPSIRPGTRPPRRHPLHALAGALCVLAFGLAALAPGVGCAWRDTSSSNHNWNGWYNNNENLNDNTNDNLNNNNTSPFDTDGDGVPDEQDPCPLDNPDDPDGDGVCSSVDPCPLDNPDDGDGDGVCDSDDPCPLDNPDDPDGDGVCTADDICPQGNDALDADGDGVPNACDPCPLDNPDDSDGDTVCDADDVCPGGDDRVDTDGNGIPDACETAATPGTYSYARLPVTMDRAVAADFHPGGSYFVVAESYDLVHLFDVATQSLLATADLHVGSGHVYFEHLRFAPSGDYALLTGYDTGTSRGVIFRLDHAAWTAGAPSTAGVFSSYANLPVVASFAAAAWGPLGGPEQLPVVLGRSGTSPYTMRLDVLNPDTGDATLLPSSAAATSAGCQDLAYANNEYGQPGLLVVCGYNGFDARYYTVVGGVPDLRTPSEMGNTNLGNTSHLAAHPSGAYALIVSNSGDAIYRFDEGLLSSYSEAVRFSTRRLWNVGFQQGGQRALVIGRKQTISGVSFGGVFEFRHDFFQCPQPLLTCDVTEVSIPNFGLPPWNAPDNTNLMDVAWRPGCDGGVIVGGYSSYNTSYGVIAMFQLVGGVPCW